MSDQFSVSAYRMEDLKGDFCEVGRLLGLQSDQGVKEAIIDDLYEAMKAYVKLGRSENMESTLPGMELTDRTEKSPSWKPLRTPVELLRLLKDPDGGEQVFRDKEVTPANCDLWLRQKLIDFLRGADQSLPKALRK